MAAELTAAGHICAIPDLTGAVTGPGPHWPAFVRRAAEAAPAGEQTLVVHSNAGLLVPALAEAVPDVRRVVFVDAALPGAPLPDAHLAALRELTGPDGLLPPWTEWFDEATVAALLPDPRLRATVIAEQPRLPLTHFTRPPPAPPGWDRLRCGYLRFSEAYRPVAGEARARGWPVGSLAGGHLHQVVAPGAVAEWLVRAWG
ncbi:alpha/beta hydrolase [Streptomyces huasconensis]|uniref:Alpha/beta hydrolase n=1 Tax=Streptomyces huasconensis TaxID=1854574 RepID=A0ABV3LVE5_9ACTN